MPYNIFSSFQSYGHGVNPLFCTPKHYGSIHSSTSSVCVESGGVLHISGNWGVVLLNKNGLLGRDVSSKSTCTALEY